MASSSILLVSSLVIVLLLTWNIVQAQTPPSCSTDFVISHQGNTLVEVSTGGNLLACPAANGNLQDLCGLFNVTSFLGNKVVGCNGNAYLKSFSLFNETTCAIPLANTPCTTAGQYVSGFDANGNPQCSAPTAGKTCTTAGQYITGFDANGNPQCSPPTANKACSNAGQYVTGFDASGNPQCSTPPYGEPNFTCSAGGFVNAFDSMGNPKCGSSQLIISAASICGNGYTANNGQLILTTDQVRNQHASAYFNTRFDFTSGFYIRFTVTITHAAGSQADGFALVVQNDPSGCGAVGTFGGGVGYEGIVNAFAVEFDTFQNNDHNDPNNNHVGIQASASLGGAISANHGSVANVIAAPVSLPTGVLQTSLQVTGTSVLQVIVSFNPASQTLSVSLGGTNIYKEVSSNSIFDVLQLNNALIGFTASTGDSTEGVMISNFKLEAPYLV